MTIRRIVSSRPLAKIQHRMQESSWRRQDRQSWKRGRISSRLLWLCPWTFLVLACTWVGCESEPEPPVATFEAAKLIKVPPTAAEYLIQGQQAYYQGAFQIALAFADSAELVAPELADTYFLRGNVFSKLNRLDAASAAFERVLELDPEYEGARMNLGNLAFREGRLREAISLYQDEQAQHPAAPVLVHMGRAYARLGLPDSARAAFERAIAHDGTHAAGYIHLAQLYEDLGDLQQALHYAQQALVYAPESPSYQYIVGTLLFRTERAAEAVPYLERVIDQRPWHSGAHSNLGQALARLGQREAAQRYLQRADSLQQLQRQIGQAQGLAEANPSVAERWVFLGQLLRRAGRYGEAVQAYQYALFLDPANLFLRSSLANLALLQGKPEEAIQRYQSILREDSTFVDGWLNLGVVYARTGQEGKAREVWQRVLRYEPDHPLAKTFLARLQES